MEFKKILANTRNRSSTGVFQTNESKLKKFLFLSIIFVFIFTIIFANFGIKELNAGTISVFIDPGHGGSDPGCIQNGYQEKNINLAIALKTSPYYGFIVSVIAPDEFTLRTTNRINRTFLITSFTPPAAIYGVNFGDPIVLNYDSYQYKMPDLVIDGPHDRIVRADPNLTWVVRCTDADFTPLPYPESWSGQGLNSMFLSEMKRLAPGDHHVSYTAYINLDLIDDGGSKVHTEYLILEKTLNFTI